MRFFDTSGPVVAEDHYCIAPLERLNLAEVRRLLRDKRYFVLHAPKTAALLVLRDLLNARGVTAACTLMWKAGKPGAIM